MKTTHERLMQMTQAYQASQVLASAVTHRFFTLIDRGHHTAEAVGAAAGTEVRGTRLVLDALVGMQFLSRRQDGYGLTEEAQAFLVEGQPRYLGDTVVNATTLTWDHWRRLRDVLQSGDPIVPLDDPEEGAHFFPRLVRGLFPLNIGTATQVAEFLDRTGWLPPVARVLDLGAGSAVWSVPFAMRDASCRVTVIDNDAVLPVTREFTDRQQVTAQYTFIGGDFFKVPMESQAFDVALLGNICHQEDEAGNRHLFGLIHPTLRTGGVLAIADMIPDDDRNGPPYPLIFAIGMYLHTRHGATYTLSEYRGWLEEAGFREVTTFHPEAHHSPIIFARK